MLKKAADIPTETITNLKEGIGNIVMQKFLTEQESQGAGRLFAKMIIPPGNSIGMHQHTEEMEAYYIIQGKALVTDNGTEIILETGDCHICPDGQGHAVQNIGDNDLEFIAIVLHTRQKQL